MTPVEAVAAALDQLCARAGVSPADGSPGAARAVAAVWDRDGVPLPEAVRAAIRLVVVKPAARREPRKRGPKPRPEAA